MTVTQEQVQDADIEALGILIIRLQIQITKLARRVTALEEAK